MKITGINPTVITSKYDDAIKLFESHIDQMIECSFEAASEIGRSYLLLDRYFLTKSAIRIMIVR